MTNKIAAFDNVVNGVTGFELNVAIGAITASAINANASAPPNSPILHINITNGATINEKPTKAKFPMMSALRKTNPNPTPPKPIQK